MAELVGDEQGAGCVIRGVKRKSQVHLRFRLRKPEDAVGDADGRYGERPMSQAEGG